MLIECLQLGNAGVADAILNPARETWGTFIDSVRVLGGDELLGDLRDREITCFAVALGGVGDNRPRQRLFELALAAGLQPLTIVHPRAIVSARATIGRGAQVLAGAVVNTGAVLQTNALINTGAIVEHDCRIGEHAHVSSGACLAGGVEVGVLAHIGAGATVRQGVRIGAGALVGAGAVVVREVAAGAVVAGVPARPLRESAEISPCAEDSRPS